MRIKTIVYYKYTGGLIDLKILNNYNIFYLLKDDENIYSVFTRENFQMFYKKYDLFFTKNRKFLIRKDVYFICG